MIAAPLYDDLEGIADGGQAYWRTASDGLRIRTAVWRSGGDKTVLVLPGRTEFIEKYGGVILQLLRRNYSVAIIDWRGQGLSERHATKRDLGWVKDFSEYQLDVAELLATTKDTGLPDLFAMIGHSMGGCIGLRSLINGLPIKKVIFSGPMWGIYVEPKMRIPAAIIARIGPGLGFGEKFVPSGSEDYYVLTEPFESNVLTNDQDQYEILKRQLQTHPDLGLGGPSLQWFNRALIETKKLVVEAPAKQDCLCLLGTEEAIVSVPAIKNVMAKWPNGKLVEVPNAHHEVLMEGRAQLELVWSEIDTHLA